MAAACRTPLALIASLPLPGILAPDARDARGRGGEG